MSNTQDSSAPRVHIQTDARAHGCGGGSQAHAAVQAHSNPQGRGGGSQAHSNPRTQERGGGSQAHAAVQAQTSARAQDGARQAHDEKRQITYAEALREALSEEMRADADVFMMGEDIGVYGGAFGVSLGMCDEFGEDRVMDTPISEAGIIGVAAGAAVSGMRPVAEMQFSDFITIGMDQLVNQAAKMRYMFGGRAQVPMVLRAPIGSGTGAAAQHSQCHEAWYAHVPGLKVVMPSTPYDAKGLLKSAIRDNNPVVFLEPKLLYRQKGFVPTEEYAIPLSISEIKRHGEDITVVSWGRMIPMVTNAATQLAEEGIEVEIIDLRTIHPVDVAPIIESVRRTTRALIVHEAVLTGGYGGEISARITESEAFYYLDEPVRRLGGSNSPIPYCPEMEKNAVPTIEKIVAAVRKMVQK